MNIIWQSVDQAARCQSFADSLSLNLSAICRVPKTSARKNPIDGRYSRCSKSNSSGTTVDSMARLTKYQSSPKVMIGYCLRFLMMNHPIAASERMLSSVVGGFKIDVETITSCSRLRRLGAGQSKRLMYQRTMRDSVSKRSAGPKCLPP